MSDGRMRERYDLARRDLAELEQQVEAGEIDEETAAGLRASYQRELEEARLALGGVVADAGSPDGDLAEAAPDTGETDEATAKPAGRSVRRVVVGAVLVVAVATVAIILAARGPGPDETAGDTGGAPGDLTVDPSSISNEDLEAVVAANPGINGMRLALADRYFNAGDYGKALDHYLAVADNDPTPQEESEAVGRIGWIAFSTNQIDAGAAMEEQALALDPGNLEAKLFLGFIKLDGLNDPEGAIPLLEEIAAFPDLPEGLRAQVDDALSRARTAAGEP